MMTIVGRHLQLILLQFSLLVLALSLQAQELEHLLISEKGSTRATAYSMSNKIVRGGGKLTFAWLDHVADIRVQSYDLQSGRLLPAELVGRGIDNHSGPALTVDPAGHLYMVFGPHHGQFLLLKSTRPFDHSAWQSKGWFGHKGTYPSLVCDASGTLHCTYRGGKSPWKIIYQQFREATGWTAPRVLVEPGVPDGYTQYDNVLQLSPDGRLHLGFHIYDLHPNGGKAIGYMVSEDSGKSWQNAGGQPLNIPVTPESDCFIEKGGDRDIRFGNLAIDSQGRPWAAPAYLHAKPRTARLWHHDGSNWISRDLLDIIAAGMPDKEISYNSLTFGPADSLYILAVVSDRNAERWWGDASQELILMTSADMGATFSITQVTQPDASKPAWLPSLERPSSITPLSATPAFLYTRGGPGEGVKGGPATRVYLALPR